VFHHLDISLGKINDMISSTQATSPSFSSLLGDCHLRDHRMTPYFFIRQDMGGSSARIAGYMEITKIRGKVQIRAHKPV
jgi:hypothetical protein